MCAQRTEAAAVESFIGRVPGGNKKPLILDFKCLQNIRWNIIFYLTTAKVGPASNSQKHKNPPSILCSSSCKRDLNHPLAHPPTHHIHRCRRNERGLVILVFVLFVVQIYSWAGGLSRPFGLNNILNARPPHRSMNR